jgi:hypothetical protein
MEQDPSTDLIAKQKSGRRYASKAFTQFKKPIELSRGYEMYTADPQDARKNDNEKRKKKRAKASKSGRRSRKTGQDEPKQKRKISDMRRMMLQMKRQYPIITILAGDLEANIKKVSRE